MFFCLQESAEDEHSSASSRMRKRSSVITSNSQLSHGGSESGTVGVSAAAVSAGPAASSAPATAVMCVSFCLVSLSLL